MGDGDSRTEPGGVAEPGYTARLRRLARSARRGVWLGALSGGLPLGGTLAGAGSFALIDVFDRWMSMYETAAEMHDSYLQFYACLWLASMLSGWFIAYMVVRSKFTASYRRAQSILHHTDALALILDDQALELYLARRGQLPGGALPSLLSGRRRIEDQLKLGAVYLNVLHAISQQGPAAATVAFKRLPGFLNPFLATAYHTGAGLSALALGCPFNFGASCILGVPLIAVARHIGLPYAEYLGNLTAICEAALGDASECTNNPVGN